MGRDRTWRGRSGLRLTAESVEVTPLTPVSCVQWGEPLIPRALPTTQTAALVIVHDHGNANAIGGLPFRIGGGALKNI